MIIDMHTHIINAEHFLTKGNQVKKIEQMFSKTLKTLAISTENENSINEQIQNSLAKLVAASQLDKILLLALDKAYNTNGDILKKQTKLYVDNDFVNLMAKRKKEFIFGASIHPYRKDATIELERVIQNGAKLIKWIPSAQQIDPENKLCLKFYEILTHYNIPLLTHTGVEHALGIRRWNLNKPRKLIPALKMGVKVIAAHCGTHLFLYEPSYFKSWARLAKEYEHLYGDTAAFSVMTRVGCLKYLLNDTILSEKIVYGSDFPGVPSPKWCWQLGIKKITELSQINNPFDQNIQVMRQLGMTEKIFNKAAKLLRITTEIQNKQTNHQEKGAKL